MFNYKNQGDILYQVENYRFRLKGKQIATIDLLYLIDDDHYAYEFELEEGYNVPSMYGDQKRSSSANLDLQQLLNIDYHPTFETKQSALQHAIDVITEIAKQY